MGSQVTTPPSGTRDFLPRDMHVRAHVFSTLKKTLRVCGFEEIDTPAFERVETLLGKYGEEGDKLIFKILRRGEHEQKGETDYALRYDLTVPLARIYADNRNEVKNPFRRFHIAPVWRADHPGKGRFREFYQCDFDIVGSQSTLCEVEIVSTAARSLEALGLDGVTVCCNSRPLLDALLAAYHIPQEKRHTATTALDKFDKIGADGVFKELTARGISEEVATPICTDLKATSLEAPARERLRANAESRALLESFDALLGHLSSVSKKVNVEFSPFLARGLDYYTGFIFEIFHPSMKSAIAGGGRYDTLIGTFVGQPVPACGGSLGIERLLMLKADEKNLPPARSKAMVGLFDENSVPAALQIVQSLRDAGIAAEISMEANGIGKQLKKASALTIPYFVFQGPDEAAKGEVSVKALETGEQKAIQVSELAKFFVASQKVVESLNFSGSL